MLPGHSQVLCPNNLLSLADLQHTDGPTNPGPVEPTTDGPVEPTNTLPDCRAAVVEQNSN